MIIPVLHTGVGGPLKFAQSQTASKRYSGDLNPLNHLTMEL